MPRSQWTIVIGKFNSNHILKSLLRYIFRSTEKLESTKLEDIIFKKVEDFNYYYRDPSFLKTKRQNPKSQASYGVSGDWHHLGCYNPYYLMKVSYYIIIYYVVETCSNSFS